MCVGSFVTDNEERESQMTERAGSDVARDDAAEAWLIARHAPDWYVGEASASEWAAAYEAVDAT